MSLQRTTGETVKTVGILVGVIFVLFLIIHFAPIISHGG